jgi:hypothetical protein
VASQEELIRQFHAGWDVVQGGGWPEWSPFVMTGGPESSVCKKTGFQYWFANSRYQVGVHFPAPARGWPPMVHLSIKAHDKRVVHDWRDLQRIKNELVGPEAEGVELYPAESRLMDESNQFHMYCVHPVASFPFGEKGRTVCTPADLEKEFAGKPVLERARQREFEDHHNGEGCSATGLIEWPDWALEVLERLGYDVCVKSAGASCKKEMGTQDSEPKFVATHRDDVTFATIQKDTTCLHCGELLAEGQRALWVLDHGLFHEHCVTYEGEST